ncbi:MAG: 3-deoxy-D-manno-octulosonic acid transferase [Gemmataceae bacterium]
MRYLLDAVYLSLFAISLPLLIFRRKYRRGLLSRFTDFVHLPFSGSRRRFVTKMRLRLPLNGSSVWFHGVSVGEIHLLRGVVAAFRRRHPQFTCVISATTETGLAEAQKWFADCSVVRWPLDFSWGVARALDTVQPELVVLAESELWPNFLLAARRRDIPVVAINVRFSPRSLGRYQRFRALARRWLGLVSAFAVQTPEYADALRRLGVTRLCVTGSVKYDGVQTDRGDPKTAALRELLNIGPDDLVWVAGSTQQPEEDIVRTIFQRLQPSVPNLRLILVPRQRERFEPVAQELQRAGVPFVRRSELVGPMTGRDVVLVDTFGELGALWGVADVAFVGGSLDGYRGGQNMIEPAALGAAVVFGPHVWNFRDTVQRLLQANATIQIQDADELEAALRRLLADAAERRRLGTAARELVREQQGATERTLDVLEQFIATSETAAA